MSEISATTRKLVRIVFGKQYHFKNPVAITETGGRVLVLNAGAGSGSITEFNAHNGALIRVISIPVRLSRRFGFRHVRC